MTARAETEGLLRDTTHLSIGQGFRLVLQAAYFILVARTLGPDRYGAFVTAVALAALLAPFSGLGAPNLFIKNVRSGKREAAACWGNGLLLSVVSGILLTVLATACSFLLHLGISLFVTFAVAFADLVLVKITELAAAGFTALGRMKETSLQSVVASSLRLAGILLLAGMKRPVCLSRWVWVYCLASALATVYAVAAGSKGWGRPSLHWAHLREDAAEGVFFSIAGSAATVYNDIDKVMLSRLGGLEATGVYAAAYRVIDVSMTPVRSLAAAAYPQFFRKGLGGSRLTYLYALSLVARASVYGVVASAGLWLCAPLLPHVLGVKYAPVAPAIRWLALIPCLRCLHSFMADALSGAGLQRTRTLIQVAVAVANITANLVVLPHYSWRGAAWTSLGCDGLLVVLFWTFASYYGRRPALTKEVTGVPEEVRG